MTERTDYRVLARKYRPQTFKELIGQEAMVRTLANAIASNRLAHAFILTGVRGVGKTTTARLIARALNCIGPDGSGGPTTEPCGLCEPCLAIAESRHVDVLEMDAASRTGVDDIREIIDGVRYAPVSARYKVYIIDEVHMLSRNAFNALLKTLEEPPPHVKFLFATTEIRKVPVTVLSRCQRFDLRRVDAETLLAHLKAICAQEAVAVDEDALTLIVRASEGSVRDALSLLDQGIAHGGGRLELGPVRDMLGLADRARIFELLEAVLSGRVADALAILREQYDFGADPAILLSDLLEAVHWVTRLSIAPDAPSASASEAERTLGAAMAQRVGIAHLSRAWQMLLKGLGETQTAPSPILAAEMVLIRLAHAADLPGPAELLRRLESDSPQGRDSGPSPARDGGAASSPAPASGTPAGAHAAASGSSTAAATARRGGVTMALRAEDGASAARHPPPQDFESLVALFHAEREPVLATLLKDRVRPVACRPGMLSFNPDEEVPPDLPRRVKACLERWTGMPWSIVISREEAGQSLREKELARMARLREDALADPLVATVMAHFPTARLVDVRAADDGPHPGEEEET
ncbi:MAG: DNA polymerase III subunit gamma/tau [Rhodothalassiaceae bacterium]